jgi:hypothetical protein
MEYKEKKVNNIKKSKTQKNKRFTGIRPYSKYAKRNGIKHISIKHKSIKHKSIKHKSIKHKSIKHKSIKHKSIKRKSIKRKSIKHKSIKHKSIKRKGIKHKSIKQSYKKYMKGGRTEFHPQSPPPEVKFTDYSPPLPGNPFATISGLQNAAIEQNNATRGLTGGSKHNKYKHRQSGGNVALCANSLINSADGFGYVPPIGCIPVPTVSDPNAQNLAISSVHISAVGQENGKYDYLVGK